MKHPSDEQWMDMLYGELDAGVARGLRDHRKDCPECDRRVGRWEAARVQLDAEVASGGRRTAIRLGAVRTFRVAAAAAIVLGIGLVTGWVSRSTIATADSERLGLELRAQWDSDIRDLRAEILADVSAELEQTRAAQSLVLVAAVEDLRSRYSEQIASLREDLETMATAAHASFTQAERQLIELASASTPTPPLSE